MTYPCHATIESLTALARRTLKALFTERAIEADPILLAQIDGEIDRVRNALDMLLP